MAEAKETELQPEEIFVRLKPILGVKPGYYLTVLYGLALALILFLILFLPGIRKFGSVVRFDSHPVAAAVYVDGAYAGATPVAVFVPSGARTISIERLGFRTDTYSLEVPGRLFASWIFPKRISSERVLSVDTKIDLLSEAFSGLSSLALMSQFTASYRPEPVATLAMKAYAGVGADGTETAARYEHAESFLKAALLNATEPELVADIIQAGFYASSGGGAPSAGAGLDTVRLFIQLANTYENSLFLLPELVRLGNVGGIVDEPWFASLVRSYGASLSFPSPLYSDSLRTIDIGGTRFIRMPGGVFARGMSRSSQEHGHLRPVSGFLMQQGEVTQGEYARFIAANREWGPENIEMLVERGLVNADYLSDWDPANRASYPVRFVSWHAAAAYAAWLDRISPSTIDVRLPTESEWEWAAIITGEDPDVVFERKKLGPQPMDEEAAGLVLPVNLLGNLWEWCDSWYYPNAYFMTSLSGKALEDTVDAFEGAERVLRGGSWADETVERIDATTRGSNPPAWCTPFAGFRVVAVEVNRAR